MIEAPLRPVNELYRKLKSSTTLIKQISTEESAWILPSRTPDPNDQRRGGRDKRFSEERGLGHGNHGNTSTCVMWLRRLLVHLVSYSGLSWSCCCSSSKSTRSHSYSSRA